MEPFPATHTALKEPNGLLAVGGDLTPQRLLSAYTLGIFPWYGDKEPILWWSPDPRCVLLPESFHLSRSLRRSMRQSNFDIVVDQRFEAVICACAAPRADSNGTWINTAMIRAYTKLHEMGYAHSIEILRNGELVGGLYGVALGRVFFGESMFSRLPDTSKIALAALVWLARRGWFELIDCQVESAHLKRLGAENLPREVFENRLRSAIKETMTGISTDSESTTSACSADHGVSSASERISRQRHWWDEMPRHASALPEGLVT